MEETKKLKPKKKEKKKLPLTPEQQRAKDEKKRISSIDNIFHKIGFLKTKTDGITINFKGRTGEIDAIFIIENVIALVEYTSGKTGAQHLLKKKPLYDLILNHSGDFIEFCKHTYPGFKESAGGLFSNNQFQVRILYAPKLEISEEVQDVCKNLFFLHEHTAKYFSLLAKTIELSAKFELLKFINVAHDDFGSNALGNSSGMSGYPGLLLPEENSSYPKGYKVVSFYADAETLIEKSYVLRRESWRSDSHYLYQRILIPKKIRSMRRYLNEEARVFVNNIIVTLPPETELSSVTTAAPKVSNASKPQRVTIQIPSKYDVIGLIDGQHRIFCYHEGRDAAEKNLKILRKKQNLLVTGIIYPTNIDFAERSRFEARLFLEINDTQSRAQASLKQDIAILVKPFSSLAISRRVIQQLAQKGPLKGMLQTRYFDDAELIKTSSIVSYGLKPLVKLEGDDSLYHSWTNSSKEILKKSDEVGDESLLDEYVLYCTTKINELLIAIKLAQSKPEKWQSKAPNNDGILSPTALNGIIVLLRELIRNNQLSSQLSLKDKLSGIDYYDFKKFKSSQWKSLGVDLYKKFFQ